MRKISKIFRPIKSMRTFKLVYLILNNEFFQGPMERKGGRWKKTERERKNIDRQRHKEREERKQRTICVSPVEHLIHLEYVV